MIAISWISRDQLRVVGGSHSDILEIYKLISCLTDVKILYIIDCSTGLELNPDKRLEPKVQEELDVEPTS